MHGKELNCPDEWLVLQLQTSTSVIDYLPEFSRHCVSLGLQEDGAILFVRNFMIGLALAAVKTQLTMFRINQASLTV